MGHTGGGYVHFPNESGDGIEFHLSGCEDGNPQNPCQNTCGEIPYGVFDGNVIIAW